MDIIIIFPLNSKNDALSNYRWLYIHVIYYHFYISSQSYNYMRQLGTVLALTDVGEIGLTMLEV